MQESGKFVINDLEKKQREKEEKKEMRKKTGYGIDSDTDSDDDGAVVGKKSSRDVKHELKKFNATKRSAMTAGIHKQKSLQQVKRKAVGHIEKFSGDAYKSAKGKGDVLKAGKHEPFSYIQLNPRMLNKRHKQ